VKKLLILLLISLSTAANAQFELSVRGGALFSLLDIQATIVSNMNAIVTATPEMDAAYQFGAWSVNVGMGYEQIGFTQKSNLFTDNLKFRNTYNYLSVPLWGGYKYPISETKFYLTGSIGIAININTGQQMASQYVSLQDVPGTRSVLPAALWGLGIGYQIDSHWSADISDRYDFSFADITTAQPSKINSLALLLGVNYTF
jgi:hypothetical protein